VKTHCHVSDCHVARVCTASPKPLKYISSPTVGIITKKNTIMKGTEVNEVRKEWKSETDEGKLQELKKVKIKIIIHLCIGQEQKNEYVWFFCKHLLFPLINQYSRFLSLWHDSKPYWYFNVISMVLFILDNK
jgi:hypothetical protein